MEKILFEIGCDGGAIKICSKCISGIFFYQLKSSEMFPDSNSQKLTFVSLIDTWSYLKNSYPKWYQLYLIQITPQVTEIVKKDYILSNDKNEYTIDSWLTQLTGRGIGF